MSAISNKQIKEAMESAQMSPPEQYMSSLRSSLSYPGHASPPEFSTDPCSIAGYGIGIASMGNPFPYKDGEKGTLPLIPTDTMIEQFSALTARVAELVDPAKQKWKLSASTIATQVVSNPVKEPSDPKYKPTVVIKIPNIGALSSGGTMNGDRVGSINWIKSKTPLMVKGKYGKDYPAVRVFMALDDKFTTFTDKFMGADGEIRQPNFGDIDAKCDLVKVWYKAADVWKSPKGLSISLMATKVVFFPGPRKIKAEFGGLTQVEPTAEELARLCGVAVPSGGAAGGGGGGGASGGASGAGGGASVPVFDDDQPYLEDEAAAESLRMEEMEREEREALEEFVRSEEKDAQERIASKKRGNEEVFDSPDRTSSSAAPNAPKKSKKTKKEDDE